jgi:GNAT superfamily N-acetyltransferase
MTSINTITIRPARFDDAALLSEVGARAFSQAFAADNTPEDMASYLAGAFYPAKQAEELARPGSMFYLLQCDGVVAGYAHIQESHPPTCITGIKPVELSRFYLLEGWIGKGIGSRLMRFCIDEARGRAGDALWLGVWQKNARAIAFYNKWGFEIAGTQTFHLGSDLQHDFVMQRSLLAG